MKTNEFPYELKEKWKNTHTLRKGDTKKALRERSQTNHHPSILLHYENKKWTQTITQNFPGRQHIIITVAGAACIPPSSPSLPPYLPLSLPAFFLSSFPPTPILFTSSLPLPLRLNIPTYLLLLLVRFSTFLFFLLSSSSLTIVFLLPQRLFVLLRSSMLLVQLYCLSKVFF